MSDVRIDLHTHSTASDGTSSPASLVREAAGAGLHVVALTDHDTTGGWAEAAAALPVGTSLVRGAEISCVHDGISLHLLAYLFDPEEPVLAAALADLRTSRTGRAQHMSRMLEEGGTGVTWARVQQLAQGTVGRPHLAQALLEQGHVASVADAFTPDWIGTRGRFWVSRAELAAHTAVRLVLGAGGVPVFAHPGASGRGRTVDDAAIAGLAAAGLTGLEVDHVDHDEPTRAHLRGLASELGLLITGSSDFHGDLKAVRLGSSRTSPEALERITAAATGVEVLAG